MEKTKGINRAQFLAGAAAVGAAGALLPACGAAAKARDEGAGQGRDRQSPGRGLTRRGIVYTVGAGETPATAWRADRMRADLRALRDDLHADTVDVTGEGVERLTATAAEAAELGLHVWLQPTLGDVPEREILDHLAETGRFAERLRRQGASVELSVGCEFWLFVPGIIPGETVLERIANLQSGNVDWARTQRRLSRFTAKAAALGRKVFHGRLSYASAPEIDNVDWSLFDVVGIDYYSYFPRRADYVRELRQHLRWGKPVTITEFGTCTFRGAPEAGGMGWDIVDYDKTPPEIKGNPLPVRSERTQAAYLTDLLDVFESMNLYAAMVFEFLTADAPHRPGDPRHDLDMASYGIAKAIQDRPGDPDTGWHWEPKEAFHAVARAYGRAADRRR
ncbi:abortive phage infection protein [Streptomyces sp. S.PB5]|uniref:abortive phage infection protein n=1 Tax=Streptomyces sp. S.PB5 TaxID=3020844 RepID=UPI0025AF7F69|nr:abortive phage infection protein [Streptomyces sp. S.PB5]MDN3020333.1 abortive phage infection protein [Streptomyces sp. S.PB5]